jgi:hypothetical protein
MIRMLLTILVPLAAFCWWASAPSDPAATGVLVASTLVLLAMLDPGGPR